MKLPLRVWLIALLIPLALCAQPNPEVVHLWANGAPGFESRKDEPQQAADYWVKNIHNPSVAVFRPAAGNANGCAVIVAPGGGFRELVFEAEGRQVAAHLCAIGVTVFALKYRLPNEPGSPYTMENVRQDAHRAIRLVRSRAREFGIDPHRVGILGFSAGGALAMMVAFDPGEGDAKAPDPVDRVNGRPDFEMFVYPGGNVPAKIPHETGPAFLVAADDDEYGCDQTALDLVARFRAAKVPVELHLIAQGKHAFNMGLRSEYIAIRHWPDRMSDWLNDRGFLRAPAADLRSAP